LFFNHRSDGGGNLVNFEKRFADGFDRRDRIARAYGMVGVLRILNFAKK